MNLPRVGAYLEKVGHFEDLWQGCCFRILSYYNENTGIKLVE